ncbi:MAG: sensor histidine kinase [Limisphaerales bacterium]
MKPPTDWRGSARWVGWGAILITLTALVAIVVLGRHQLLAQMRGQIIGRDALILHALAQQEQESGRDAVGEGEGLDLSDVLAQYELLLRISGLSNIIAARLFDARGEFVAGVPVGVRETAIDPATLSRLAGFEPTSEFRSDAPWQDLFPAPTGEGVPEPRRLSWVEASIPLVAEGGQELEGIAQFILEGVSVEREFALLEARLNRQTWLMLGGGGGLVGLALAWAFRRLERANRLLAARTADLQRANVGLAQTAKVAALGAVTAHLVHSLRNPVAGLNSFMAARQEEGGGGDDGEWHEAMNATRRLQDLIQQVTQVIQESQEGVAYEASIEEIGQQVLTQVRSLASAREVRAELEVKGRGVLDNRVAGLLRLILINLVENAIEASPSGGRVELILGSESGSLVFEVRDQGTGIPEPVRRRLFEPVTSTKEGGSGIGLAISRQLAQHLDANLELVTTSTAGTVFRLRLPGSREPDEHPTEPARK